MKKRAKDSEQSHNTGTMDSPKGSTMSLNGLLDCSVVLERIDVDEANTTIASDAVAAKHESPAEPTAPMSQPEIVMAHSEVVAVDMEIESIEITAPTNDVHPVANHNEVGYADAFLAPANEAVPTADDNGSVYSNQVNVEHAPQMNYDQNSCYFDVERFNEMLDSSMRLNYDHNQYNAYDYNLNQENPPRTYGNIHPNFQVKEEKIQTELHTLPQTLANDSMIYEILDSDEEEALNARDSGRETNDTIILDTDASHIPTMGVLMMAKK